MARHYSGIQSRKGTCYLPRLAQNIPFESTIEESYARITGMNPAVQSIQRAEPITVYSPDGSTTTYTPDFMVNFLDGRVFTVECKPASLLHDLLRADPVGWLARASLLQHQGRPLYIVTEEDLPHPLLKHEQAFAAFHGVPVDPAIRDFARNLLLERGAMSYATLRDHLLTKGLVVAPVMDGSLNALIAGHELIADIRVSPPDCLVDLPGRAVAAPPPITGRLLSVVLQNLPDRSEAIRSTPESVPNSRFAASQRGRLYQRLFALYPDPTVPFGEDMVTHLAEQTGLSRATLYRYRQALLAAGEGITFPDLVPHLTNPTGRVRRKVDDRVSQIMEGHAEKHYFVGLGTLGRARSVSDLYGLVRQACLREGLLPPVYNTVAAHLTRMEQRDPFEARKRRDGIEEAHKIQARQGHLGIQRYGELLGIDCTPCDVFTKEGLLSPVKSGRGKGQCKRDAVRGNIVTVVDVATSRVLRSDVFIGAISAARILTVLREVFLGETTGTVARVPAIPRRIRMDAGTEFVNRQVSRVLAGLGIEVLPRNKGTKHHGGIEERMIGTLSHAHHVLPGTTTNNITNRGEYDAQKGAAWSMADLRGYHQKVVERLNALCAPLRDETRDEHAQRLVEGGQSVWRPLSGQQLAYIRDRFLPMEVRRCGRAGISLHGLNYTAPALEGLIMRRAEVEVLYNPDDISTAQVIHPDTGAIILATARLPLDLEPPLSLADWQGIHSRIRQNRQAAADRVKPLAKLAAEIEEERQAKLLGEKREKQQEDRKQNRKRRVTPTPDFLKKATSPRAEQVILLDDNAPLEA